MYRMSPDAIQAYIILYRVGLLLCSGSKKESNKILLSSRRKEEKHLFEQHSSIGIQTQRNDNGAAI